MQKSKTRILLILVTLSMLIVAFPSQVLAAPDLDSASDWAREEITAAVARGFVPEVIQGNYTAAITRAEFAQLTVDWLAYATNTSTSQLMIDYDIGSLYGTFVDTNSDYILLAYAMGITMGIGDGRFAPDNLITREQSATLVKRAMVVGGFTPQSATILNSAANQFADQAQFSHWAREGIGFAVHNNIMQGVGDNLFNPGGDYQRQMAIAVFHRISTDTLVIPADPAVITYMFWGDALEIINVTNVLNWFNQEHPHIRVEPWSVDLNEFSNTLVTLAAAGDLPDAGFMTEEILLSWARLGLIEAPLIIGEQPRDVIAFVWEGETVAYSSSVVQLALYYNTDMFDAAGISYPPKTAATAWSWDEFVSVAKTLTIDRSGNNAHSPNFDRSNIVQYGFYLEPAVFQLEMWALSNGGGFFDANDWRNVIINEPEAAEAIQRIADLYLVHGVMPRWGSLSGTIDSWFLEYNVAMAVNGTWSIGVWLNEAARYNGLNYSVAVPPSMGTSVTIATAGVAVQYVGSAHPEAVAEFLAWFTATESNWGLIEYGIWLPRYESWYTDEALLRLWADNDNHPPFEDFRSAVVDFSLTNAVSASWHWVPGSYAFLPALADALAPVWSGAQTAQDALNAARPAFVRAIGG